MSLPSQHPFTRIALGTSPLGFGTTRGADDETAALATAAALLQAEEALVDTSNNYAGGRSEEVLGDALAALDEKTRAAASSRLVTKVDRHPDTGVFDSDRVRRSAEESLTRLGIDHLPLLHLHDPYVVSFEEAMAPGGAVEALVALRAEGVAGRIGIAAGAAPLVRKYVDTGVFDAVLCHNRFTLVDRSAEPLFAAARALGMTVFNAAPFGAGLLARGPVENASYGYRPAGPELLAWTRDVERLCAEFSISLQAAALHFSMRSPLIDRTVVGISSAQRLAQLRALCETSVPEDFWAAFYELPPAPTPVDDSAYGGTA